MEPVSVYVTAPDEETARKLARLAIERRLAACATMLPAQSIYTWEGRLQEAREVVLFLKTRRSLVPDLTRALEEEHPYEVPCIVALPIVGGAQAYLDWVEAETAPAHRPA